MLKKMITVLALWSPLVGFAESHSGKGIQAEVGQEEGFSLEIKSQLLEKDGNVTLLSTSVSPITIPAESIRGKPYLIATFPGGFSPGNDPAIDYHWGFVGDDLSYNFTTPAHYKNGPYDAVLIVYVNTPITDDIRNGDPSEAPVPVKGDLASFTADDSVVLGDDPGFSNGLVRLNVRDANAAIELSNRLPGDSSFEEIMKALTNTVMIIP